jgi:hypothetical protein
MSVSSTNSSTTSTRFLRSAERNGAAVRNTDANVLYVLLDSGEASATNHTVALAEGDYYETPFGYTGEINGVWAGDGAGAALVTEF